MNRHTQGVLLIFLSAMAYSSAGFFTRLIQLDPWTMLFWRGLVAGLFISAVIAVRTKGRAGEAIAAIGAPGIWVSVCSTAASIFFLNALSRTSVADVAVIFATIPFLAAVIGWLWLGAMESWSTLGSCLIALLGVAVMVGGAMAEGHLLGDLLAFCMAALMAVVMLILRERKDTDMLPAAALSAFLCPLAVWPFASPFAIGPSDLVDLSLFGIIQFGLGLVFLTLGGRLLSATENGLINTLETPLAVLWVWIPFGETPTQADFIGGAIVIAAVGLHVWHTHRSELVAVEA